MFDCLRVLASAVAPSKRLGYSCTPSLLTDEEPGSAREVARGLSSPPGIPSSVIWVSSSFSFDAVSGRSAMDSTSAAYWAGAVGAEVMPVPLLAAVAAAGGVRG